MNEVVEVPVEEIYTLKDVKSMLFDALLAMSDNGSADANVAANQQMAVGLTRAVKKDGVNIIQFQNVAVTKVMPHLVNALKTVDVIIDTEPVKQIEHNPKPLLKPLTIENPDPVDECLKFLYETGVQWKEMQDMMKERYATFIAGQFRTYDEAATFLGIRPAYLGRLIKAIENRS